MNEIASVTVWIFSAASSGISISNSSSTLENAQRNSHHPGIPVPDRHTRRPTIIAADPSS